MSSTQQSFTQFIQNGPLKVLTRGNTISNRSIILLLLSSSGFVVFLYQFRRNYLKKKRLNESNLKTMNASYEKLMKKKKKQMIHVDKEFFKRLVLILKIVMPSIKSKEFTYFITLSILLLLRTYLTVEIAEILGTNAQFLVSRQYSNLLEGVLKFAAVSIPASAVNSGLKYCTSMLSLRFRVKLSRYVHDKYIRGVNFYKATNLGGDERISHADQRVTSDINNFSNAISELYTTIFKPVLDVVLFTAKLIEVTGWQGPAIMYAYFFISGWIKKNIMPSFGKLVAKESELEGRYRTAHQRLITCSEEIAFFDGSEREKEIINDSLHSIFQHVSYVRYLKGLVAIFDGLLVKYWASIAGYGTLSAPLIFNLKGAREKSSAILTRDYIRNSQYLGKLSTAVGDLVLVGNKLTSIAGYTSRVTELLEKIEYLNTKGNVPFNVREEQPVIQANYTQEAQAEVSGWLQEWVKRCDQRPPIKHKDTVQSSGKGGQVIIGEDISFSHVDIISPEGKVLVRDLNMNITKGEHVFCTGPNGCGKSSVFRVLAGLWPLSSGTLTKPHNSDMVFIPQKSYLVLGTLRDQIIYPHNEKQMKKLGVTDDDLRKILSIVDPAGNILKEWTFDTEKDWFHTFSGGQKQRVAMARVFYHRPKYAILDECTSAVSDEVEDAMYKTCRDLGITIFTVSHRASLMRHHDYVLRLDGHGGWTFENKLQA